MADETQGSTRKRRKAKRRLGFWTALAVLLLLGAYAAVLETSRPHVTGDRLRFDRFVDLVEAGRIKNAHILNYDSFVVGDYVPGRTGDRGGSLFDGRRATPDGASGPVDGPTRRYNTPFFKSNEGGGGGGDQGLLLEMLLSNDVPTTIDQQIQKTYVGPATVALPALLVVVVFVYLILSYQRGTGLFSIVSGAHKIKPEDAKVTFADVAGQDAAVAELREISLFLSDPERFTAVGAKIPSGVLVYGPPGCGKTLCAKALAGESGASFYAISGADFVELYVGVGASRVRDLFKEARENAPAIIFIDEIDSLGRRRGAGGAGASRGSAEEQEQALNQILAEMDGFSSTGGVIVVGATNRPDVLDPALLRPGRFDRTIALDRPDEKERLAILGVHARDKRLDPAATLEPIAQRAVGLTGADLASIVNEAALLAARAGKRSISQTELDDALTRVMEAPERQRRLSMRGRSLGQRALAEERVTFADVAGIEEALEELAEVKDYLAEPARYVAMGARPPRGFLLVGPPGCGKTLLARAVANEANAAFVSVSATEFVEVFVGEGAARVRDVFADARAMAPAIVFIDEIDAIGARRGSSPDGHREREQTLNQILIELDGFSGRAGVIVMAATNRAELLDPALVRPGRFDRTITLNLPDRAARRAILEVHARGKPLARSVDLDAVAAITQGLSGAELANALNEAVLLAARRGLREATMPLVEEGIERVSQGISRSHVLSARERSVVAYHEAGHAVLAMSVPGASIPHKVSIIPRGRALGVAWVPDSDGVIFARSELLDRMAVLLGGRVAEEMIFGEPGSGAADDLARVARIARWMVSELGMSRAAEALTIVTDGGKDLPYSEETTRAVDAEAHKLVEEAKERARTLLAQQTSALERIASALLERETLTARDLETLFAGAVDARSAKVMHSR